MKQIFIVLLATLTIVACKNKEELNASQQKRVENKTETTPQSTAEKIAYASGIEHWDAIEEISFTFNVKRGTNPVFSRAWTWQPKTNQVHVTSATDTLTYNRNNIDSLSLQADKAFINDKYWLHAPFNLIWDEGTTITESKDVIAPISKDTLKLILTTKIRLTHIIF